MEFLLIRAVSALSSLQLHSPTSGLWASGRSAYVLPSPHPALVGAVRLLVFAELD